MWRFVGLIEIIEKAKTYFLNCCVYVTDEFLNVRIFDSANGIESVQGA